MCHGLIPLIGSTSYEQTYYTNYGRIRPLYLRVNGTVVIALIEPSDKHYYQAAWTLVGGGAYEAADTVKDMADVIPKHAEWIQVAAASFDPDNNLLNLTDGRSIGYRQLIVCPGIRLAWEKINMGKN